MKSYGYKPQNNLDQVHFDVARKPLFKTYPTHKNNYSRKSVRFISQIKRELPCLPAGIRSYYSPRVPVPLLHSQVAPLVLKIIPWIRPYLTTYINSASYRTFSTAQCSSWYFTNINHGLKLLWRHKVNKNQSVRVTVQLKTQQVILNTRKYK